MSSNDIKLQAEKFKRKNREAIELIIDNLIADNGKQAMASHLNELAKYVLQFMRQTNHTNYTDDDECCDDIEKVMDGFGVKLTSGMENYLEACVAPELMAKKQEIPSIQQQAKKQVKQTKKQEVKQYPARYTTSKPTPPKDMTSTYKPKLNLQHIQQVDLPPSVSPSENTRKAKLSVSSSESHHVVKQSKHKKAHGQIEGLEEDGRLFNSEKNMYIQALDKVGNLQQPAHRIHATNEVRAAVWRLPNATQLANRLTNWR